MIDAVEQLTRCAQIFEGLSRVMRKEEDGIERHRIALTGSGLTDQDRSSTVMMAEARRCQEAADRLRSVGNSVEKVLAT